MYTMTLLQTMTKSEQDYETLLQLKKQLRRLKRRLFLEVTTKSVTEVDKFRELILNLALDETVSTEELSSLESFQSGKIIHAGC
jgi:hypothetical protein